MLAGRRFFIGCSLRLQGLLIFACLLDHKAHIHWCWSCFLDIKPTKSVQTRLTKPLIPSQSLTWGWILFWIPRKPKKKNKNSAKSEMCSHHLWGLVSDLKEVLTLLHSSSQPDWSLSSLHWRQRKWQRNETDRFDSVGFPIDTFHDLKDFKFTVWQDSLTQGTNKTLVPKSFCTCACFNL